MQCQCSNYSAPYNTHIFSSRDYFLIIGRLITQWSIDANSDWTPDIALKYLHDVLLPHNTDHRIYMVEQPFSPHLVLLSFSLSHSHSFPTLSLYLTHIKETHFQTDKCYFFYDLMNLL
jgi:hypothetical protein